MISAKNHLQFTVEG